MTHDEFTEFLTFHCSNFPGLRPWILRGGQSQGPPAPAEDVEGIYAAWERRLETVALEEAKRASDEMADDPEKAPTGWGTHPATIRRMCFGGGGKDESSYPPGPRWIHGEFVVDCPLCEDGGMRKVYTRKAIELWQNDRKQFRLTTAVVACSCKYGHFWLTRKLVQLDGHKRRPVPKYDPERMVLCDTIEEENSQAALADFVERASVERQAELF